MIKPAKAIVPGRVVIAGGAAKAAQPGNAPGRGKSAHVKAAAKPKPVSAAVHKARHAAAVKASKTRAANARKAAAAKKAAHHPVRKLALGAGVACCSAEAVAASLRLAGWPVGDEDVLALYWRTAGDVDAGASILATLEAAAEFGLAGCRPAACGRRGRDYLTGTQGGHLPVPYFTLGPAQSPQGPAGCPKATTPPLVILGITDPAPHAVLATADGWWSWGELYEPWTADIDEAWEVTWPGIR